MSIRRCATEGCTGTLPSGTGKHCPKCGGTQFLPRGRSKIGRAFVVLFILVAITTTAILLVNRAHKLPATGTNDSRKEMIAARSLASEMTMLNSRDNAYAGIVDQAIAKNDYEFACDVAGDMTMLDGKDKAFDKVVDAALKNNQPAWAKHAADQMTMLNQRDAALKKIMDAAK